MPSALAWLDQSEEAQRRARELIRMFQETESRDELGLGQIRDIYSDWLFPGTSVIQTRARYFLIIPWLFKYHENKKRAGDELLKRVQADERLLIERLKSPSSSGTGAEVDVDGLIGIQKGAAVKTLPSTIYWNGLRRLGILRVPSRPDELGISSHPTEADPDATEELATRQIGNWHPTLPPPPEGFPRELPGGLRLEAEEASWLRDVVLEAAPNTLLSHLIVAPEPPSKGSEGPWDDPVALTWSGAVRHTLEEACLFSLIFHGAALLYNVMLADEYNKRGRDRGRDEAPNYLDEVAHWAEEIERNRSEIEQFDIAAAWQGYMADNPRISTRTRRFVFDWVGVLRQYPPENLAKEDSVRDLIRRRELEVKGPKQSRLHNEKLLEKWNKASGIGRINFRWGTVRTLVTDVISQLNGA